MLSSWLIGHYLGISAFRLKYFCFLCISCPRRREASVCMDVLLALGSEASCTFLSSLTTCLTYYFSGLLLLITTFRGLVRPDNKCRTRFCMFVRKYTLASHTHSLPSANSTVLSFSQFVSLVTTYCKPNRLGWLTDALRSSLMFMHTV